MKRSSIKWINAAKILVEEPNAIVSCPSDETYNLIVFDVVDQNNSDNIERYMVCPKDYSYNVIKIHRKIEQNGLVPEFSSEITFKEAVRKALDIREVKK